jgi:hypothetical protein
VAAGAFLATGFMGTRIAFFAGLALFAGEAFFFWAFGLAGFFEAFFFAGLAIISVSPLGSRARAEA